MILDFNLIGRPSGTSSDIHGHGSRSRRISNILAIALTASLGLSAAHGQIVPNPAHNWDATTDTNANTLWEDTGTQGDRPWTLTGALGANPLGPKRVAISSLTSITHAYDFDGTDDAGSAAAENRSGNHNTSFEIWFKPSEFPITPAGAARVIFEHGNGPRGVSIGLAGSNLIFVYGASPDFGMLSFNLDVGSDGIDNPDFIQMVGVVDDTNNQLRLYVDGANEQLLTIAASNDFTSNDTMGLGLNSGQGGGGQDGTAFNWSTPFNGEISIVREYRSAFGPAQALQNYRAIAVPEPAAGMGLLAIAAGMLAARRRISS